MTEKKLTPKKKKVDLEKRRERNRRNTATRRLKIKAFIKHHGFKSEAAYMTAQMKAEGLSLIHI